MKAHHVICAFVFLFLVVVVPTGPVALAQGPTRATTPGTVYLPFIPRYVSPFVDPTFGIGGFVHPLVFANGMVIQSDGKILVGGFNSPTPGTYDIVALRYNPDGTPDAAFGSGGVASGMNGRGIALAIQPDGKIVEIGAQGALVRFTPGGLPDPTFHGGGGYYDPACPGLVTPRSAAVVIQADGKIVAAGHCGVNIIARYLADGTPDPGFGNNGQVTTFLYGALALAVQSDGKLLAAGAAYFDNRPSVGVVSRFNSDGTPDPTFGQNGVRPYLPPGAASATLYSLAIQPDGKILAAGEYYIGSYQLGVVLVRLLPDGTLDSTFGSGGAVQRLAVDYGETSLGAPSIALGLDGRVVMIAFYMIGFGVGSCGDRLWRYTPSGAPDLTFGFSGTIQTATAGCAGPPQIGLQPDGRIVAFLDIVLTRYVAQ